MKLERPIADDRIALHSAWPVIASRRVETTLRPECRTPVTHSYAVLAFYTAGSSRVQQNGEWKVQARDAAHRRNAVLLVPAGEPHRTLERQRAELWGLGFCVPCLAADSVASLLEPFERVRDGGAAVVHIPDHRHAYLEGLFIELERVGREEPSSSGRLEAVQRSLLTLILAEVDRAATALGNAGDARKPAVTAAISGVVVDALRFIERNCLRRLSLQEVAAAVGRSPTYVTAALAQATGRSAGEWIVSGRMAEARRLLLHSATSVEQVAQRVGYADATHFIRMFRREHGATPVAWRSAREADARR